MDTITNKVQGENNLSEYWQQVNDKVNAILPLLDGMSMFQIEDISSKLIEESKRVPIQRLQEVYS